MVNNLSSHTVKDLNDLYEAIAGRNPELNWLNVPGITTYPQYAGDDVIRDPTGEVWKHTGCLKLEGLGRVRRVKETEEYIYWKVVE